MEVMELAWGYVVPFLVLLTVLVFVHELGHYSIARWCGVRVEVFSIGFGPELFGFTASSGTRWKVSAIPLGGYVKMFGENQPAGERNDAKSRLSEEQRSVSFHHKPLGQRAAIVFAGPFANYLFAIIILAAMFTFYGQPTSPTNVGKVLPNSAAEKAGFQPGDIIRSIDGAEIERFQEIQQKVRIAPGETLIVTVERTGRRMDLTVIPEVVDHTDRFGNKQRIGRLGIQGTATEQVMVRYDPVTSTWKAVVESVVLTKSIFKAVGQIITGARGTDELGGPLRIAKVTGDLYQVGIDWVLTLAAILSLNLALINLFPIPMLDGGHLMFYAFEAIRGRPLGERVQEYGFRIGIALVLALMVFVTWNDLVELHVIDFFVDLVT